MDSRYVLAAGGVPHLVTPRPRVGHREGRERVEQCIGAYHVEVDVKNKHTDNTGYADTCKQSTQANRNHNTAHNTEQERKIRLLTENLT